MLARYKLLILCSAFLLILTTLVSASYNDELRFYVTANSTMEESISNYTIHDSESAGYIAGVANDSRNFTDDSGGWVYYDVGWADKLNKHNFTINMMVKRSGAGESSARLFSQLTTGGHVGVTIARNSANSYYECGNGGGTVQFGIPDGVWTMITCTQNTDGNISIYVNGTLVNTTAIGTPGADGDPAIGFGSLYVDAQEYAGLLDEMAVWNRTLDADEILALYNNGDILILPFASDSPVVIDNTTYNATSAYSNNTAWQTSTQGHVILQDTTPLIYFETDLTSNCSIGLSDLNYTDMVSADANTKCATTETTQHTCTLPSSQNLTWEDEDNIYISCIDNSGFVETNSSTSGSLKIKRIPYVQYQSLSEGYYLDLTTDGTNYGETSEGWTVGESTLKTLTPIDTNNEAYLLIRITRLDASIDIYIDNSKYGDIPADSGGSGEWDIYAFKINSSDITTNTIINLTADATNIDTTYIDYIILADTANITDGVVANNSALIYYINTTNTSRIDSDYALIYNESNTLLETNSTYINYNTITDTGYGNTIISYHTPNVDQNYSIGYKTNFTNYAPSLYGTNQTMEIDSTAPNINTITTDLNTLCSLNYSIDINTTEKNDNFIQISVNDSSFTAYNLTSDPNNTDYWNGSINYSIPYNKTITIYAQDKAGHTNTFSFGVKSSNATNTINGTEHNTTWTYNTTYLNITDTSTTNNLTFKINFTITGIGDAYIDDYNITYTINDTLPINIKMTYNNGSNISFGNYNTSLEWNTDSWNNTATNPTNISNTLTYTLNNSLTLEWENSGVSNVRLFYASMTNKNTSLDNISVHIPFRTTYNGSTSSIDLYECTSGINWAGGTCDSWTEITTTLYTQSDQTYHWGNSSTQYPTVDTNSDGKQDTLYFKIPTITTEGEVMYKIDLDASNPETTWTGGSGDPASPGGGSAGGSSGENPLDPITGDAIIPSSTGSSNLGKITTFFKSIIQMAEDLWNKFMNQVKKVDFSDPTNVLLIFGIVVVFAGTFALSRPTKNKKGVRTSDLKI